MCASSVTRVPGGSIVDLTFANQMQEPYVARGSYVGQGVPGKTRSVLWDVS